MGGCDHLMKNYKTGVFYNFNPELFTGIYMEIYGNMFFQSCLFLNEHILKLSLRPKITHSQYDIMCMYSPKSLEIIVILFSRAVVNS